MSTNDRVLFNLPKIGTSSPLKTHPLYEWYMSQDNPNLCFRDAFTLWASGLGFDLAAHYCDAEALQQARYALESAQHNWFYEHVSFNLSDIFEDTDEIDSLFWVTSPDCNSSKKALSENFRRWLESNNFGLIYKLEPKNYYFQIAGDALHIKYQHIVGGRKLCKLLTK